MIAAGAEVDIQNIQGGNNPIHITIDIVNVKEGATVLSRLLVRDLPLHTEVCEVSFRAFKDQRAETM